MGKSTISMTMFNIAMQDITRGDPSTWSESLEAKSWSGGYVELVGGGLPADHLLKIHRNNINVNVNPG